MTDSRPRRTAPRLKLSGREWKLYLVGGLGLAYAASFSAIASQVEPGVDRAAATPSMPEAAASNAVWLEELPAAARPNIAIPPNWILASSLAPTPVGVNAPTSPVAALGAVPGARSGSSSGQIQPASRAPRILTRTS